MQIRLATDSDIMEMRAVVEVAFGDEGPLISELVTEMSSTVACFIWVAEDSGVKGLVGASKAAVGSEGGGFWVLAPLGVSPDSQGMGIGGQLVRHCLQELKDDGASGVFVYGDPSYYSRFGFSAEDASWVKAPFELEYPEGWQVLLWEPIRDGEVSSLKVIGPLAKPDLW